ncbi:hypothetical protein GWK47_050981 [Chionoecetes opilio]|uniref:Uncharacterized protein n=1 Tax=Chionoecetes opilio TaxID=41210 RepID=A0A8J4Y2B2_CHIOP|nr:hypothetical protein GWK47_050981 [Chionoecetes opilio]
MRGSDVSDDVAETGGHKDAEECFFKTFYNCGVGKLIQSSRIDTILAASNLRQDDIRLRKEMSDGSSTVRCHKNCVSKYVSPSTLNKLGKRMPKEETNEDSNAGPKQLRSSIGGDVFDFQKHCLFCHDITPCILPNEYDPKVPQQYRVPASRVTTDKMGDGETYKQYLLDLCEKRGDELGRIVRNRIIGAPSDLHAADAKYHRSCNANFHRDAHRTTMIDSKGSADDQAFAETVHVLVCDRSKVWNSLDVEAVYADKGASVMSRRVLAENVIQHFAENMLALHPPGVATLLVFRKHVATNLRLVDDDYHH